MHITTIRYRRLQSHERGYGHDAVEAAAQIDAGEDPEAALAELKVWVLHRLDGIREIDRHCETLDSLRHQVVDREREKIRLDAEIKRNREIIAGHEKLAELARKEGIDGADLTHWMPLPTPPSEEERV